MMSEPTPEPGAGLRGVVFGAGPGVLWLHGYTMDSLVWAPLWAQLPDYRHVGLDLPGHGDSRALRPGEGLAELADEIAEAAAAAGVRHVVGMSFGSVVALELALRHPGLATSWVLAAPAVIGAPTDPAVERRYLELWRAHAQRGPGPHLTALWVRTPPDIFAGVLARPPVAELVLARIDRHRWAELASGAMRRLTDRPQNLSGLARLAPGALLVVIGEHELPVHRSAAHQLVGAVARARLEVVAGAGHLAPIEEPAVVAPLLSAHWAGGADG